MPEQLKPTPQEKAELHPRNPHRLRYDFQKLISGCPELAGFVSLNEFEDESIDFKDPAAVKALNKALLKQYYGINFWDIPEGYLCPPIPGRADYMHYMADLLGAANGGVIPRGKSVKVLDIGVGANCIYPIIGKKEYGWDFVGADTDHLAIRSANNIIQANAIKGIEIRKQGSSFKYFDGIIRPGEKFHLSVCNPPFHASGMEAEAGSQRKWKNLDHRKQADTILNFGGQSSELWCEGGEEAFLERMIKESAAFAKNCTWFSSLISKKTTLPGAYYALKKVGASEVKTIDMAQGQKVSRVLAWTFMELTD